MTFALEIKNLCKSFGGIKVTQDVSFSVKPGERRLIIGPNGAGKTTLFNQISGELKPDSGSIKVFGEDLTFQPVHRRAHAGVSRTYQIITLFPKDTLLHNVVLSLMGVSNRRFQAFSPLTANDVLFEKAESILDSVGLTGSGHLAAGEISYGEQRRVEIAVAMAQSPRLLLLDEPLAGLSQDERIIVRDLVAALPKTTTIVMIEHDMDVAFELADRINVFHQGQMIVEGSAEEVRSHPQVNEIYLGAD